ncbi:MAG: RHS repeat protein, partial [Proteobacteria bacterium]|nr:RHS repeat protein [Pseudomonadota bacterium]
MQAGAFQLIIGGGHMSPHFGAYMEARSTGEDGAVQYNNPNYQDGGQESALVGAQRATKRRFGANYATQLGSAIDMVERIGAATTAVHDVVIGAGSLTINGFSFSPSGTLGALSSQSSISVVANSGDAALTLSLRRTVAALSATLEGSAVQQSLDSVFTATTASRFDWVSTSDNTAGQRFFWANAANWTYVSAQIQNNYENGSPTRSAVQDAVNAGNSVIVPENSNLGPGLAQITFRCGQVGGVPQVCVSTGPERGGAFIALNSGAIDHEVTVTAWTHLAGGAGTDEAEENPLKIFSIPETFLERQYSSRAEAYNVDLNSGVVSYTPPPDLVVGEGGYPYALSFQRSYRSGGGYDQMTRDSATYQITASQERFGDSGWTSNFNAEARLQNDGGDAFGVRSPREATDTIAVIRALIALNGDQSSDLATLEYQVAAMHVLAWWSEQLVYNSVILVHGPESRSFVQLADGAFNPPPGDSTQITLYGQRTAVAFSNSSEENWSYDGMCVREVAHDGSTSYYGPWLSDYSGCNSSGSNGGTKRRHGLRFRHQVFPQGVTVDFDDTTLSNNLGRSLALNGGTQTTNTPSYTVTDGVRSAAINLDLSAGPGKLSVTGTDGNTWVYDGSSPSNWRVFAPSSTTIPIAQFNYVAGTLGEVDTLTDGCRSAANCGSATGNVSHYYTSSGRIGAMTDALGHQSRIYYDENGQPVRSIDRNGNETDTQYDVFHRATDVHHPEGNWEHTDYDTLNNPIQVTRHPKPGSSLPNIVTSASYDATCGIPTSQTDANGNLTATTLLTGRCLPSQVSQPAVDDGTTSSAALVNPITSYTWNSLGQRLTKTDPTGIVTTNAYDAASHYLTSVTIASGALNLTTTFARNIYGDINSVTDPNGHVFTGTYDASRRLTQFNGPTGTNVQTLWTYNVDGEVQTIQQATGLASPNNFA